MLATGLYSDPMGGAYNIPETIYLAAFGVGSRFVGKKRKEKGMTVLQHKLSL